MATQGTDPYATPNSDVRDTTSEEYGEAKVFSFSGRIGRLRYLAYSMGLLLIIWFGGGILAAVTIPMMSSASGEVTGILATLLLVVIYGVMLVATFALAVRRINDFDTSGWLSLLLLVPLANMILMLFLWFMPGTQGENKYGLQPPPNGTGVTILAMLAPLLVVGYMGVVASIAIPEYQKYVERAHSQQMQQR